MKIKEVYEKYKIAPWLAEHMFRVTAVAVTIFDELGLKEGRDELICAGLFHDLGNIVKFNFDKLQIVESADLSYWEDIKKDFILRYSENAHHATLAILREMGVRDQIIEVIDGMSFTSSFEIAKGTNSALQILTYADMRVVPSGISSLQSRIDDMYKRYTEKHPKDSEKTKQGVEGMFFLEQMIFQKLKIKPEDINEESTFGIQEKLRDFDISSALK